MNNIINISDNLIDVELQIKLVKYLNNNNFIDDNMYNYVVNKLLKNKQR